jgi:Ca2+-binding EF-hand superfamily protein
MVKESVLQTFNIFDNDDSYEIDPEEALNHLKNNFGKISAKEFFNQVDFDGDGKITE